MEEKTKVMEPEVEVGSAADVDEIMKKYDRESNTRAWSGTPGMIVKTLSILFSIYCIWSTLFSTAMPEVRLNIFLACILVLGYLHYPIKKGMTRPNHLPIYDLIIMIAGAFPFVYFAMNAQTL